MNEKNLRLAYALLVPLVFAGLALARPDLVAGAYKATAASLAAGGLTAVKVSLKILLLGAILLLAARFIPLAGDPRQDGIVVLTASVLGYLAELAGTTLGLWTYYTGEKPPLWIVPAWPLGALLVGRLATPAGRRLAKLPAAAPAWIFRAWLLAFLAVFTWFTWGKLPVPAWLAAAALAASLLPGEADRSRDAAVLLTGTACVFWADLWGTTNNCWVYHTQPGASGLAAGILFGAFFDTVLVLLSLKAADYLKSVSRQS